MLWFDLSFFLNPRDQQSPISPQLREAEPHGPTAQPQDPAELRPLAAQPTADGAQRLRQPAQPCAAPEPCDPAARPSTSDLHPREQVRRRLDDFLGYRARRVRLRVAVNSFNESCYFVKCAAVVIFWCAEAFL